MAKYVTLSFEDDEEAKEFIQRFTDDVEERSRQLRVGTYAAVVAMYKKPTRFCDCDVTRPFTRGSKYGWWVHAIRGCMSPTLTWVKNRLEMREYNELKEVD
jgi:hypothetical protein